MPTPLTRTDVELLRRQARDLRDGQGGSNDDAGLDRAADLDAIADAIQRELESARRMRFEAEHLVPLREEVDALWGAGRGVAESRIQRAKQLKAVLEKLEARVQ